MLISHAGKNPTIDPTAWIAPDATICGDVRIGPHARVMHGARIIAEGGGSIAIGRACIVLENAVVRSSAKHTCTIGNHCLIGPGAHVAGALVEDEVFIATGAAIFQGARVGHGAEIRINGTVHLRSRIEPGTIVPIGWIAVGDPAEVLPPQEHDHIWTLQEPLDFPQWVYGIDRSAPDLMILITQRLSESLGAHANDRPADSQSHTRTEE